jgi:hypothetical protein
MSSDRFVVIAHSSPFSAAGAPVVFRHACKRMHCTACLAYMLRQLSLSHDECSGHCMFGSMFGSKCMFGSNCMFGSMFGSKCQCCVLPAGTYMGLVTRAAHAQPPCCARSLVQTACIK